jgi:hypothetical protein
MIRPYIQLYPEINATISEVWQAEKWLKEVPLDNLSPMWANWEETPYKHFYVNELAQLDDGSLVIPICWVVLNKQVYANLYYVKCTDKVSLM